MYADFDMEYKKACEEYNQLKRLLDDVYWYYFETMCYHWKPPWYVSMGGSEISLNGCRNVCVDGCRMYCTYPIWYSGAIAAAPQLPPSIVLSEVNQAKAYMLFMREQRDAPYDWAPGGEKYQQLLREGAGVHAYDILHSKRQSSDRE